MNLVALVQEELGQVAAVLSSYAGDEGDLGGLGPVVVGGHRVGLGRAEGGRAHDVASELGNRLGRLNVLIAVEVVAWHTTEDITRLFAGSSSHNVAQVTDRYILSEAERVNGQSGQLSLMIESRVATRLCPGYYYNQCFS